MMIHSVMENDFTYFQTLSIKLESLALVRPDMERSVLLSSDLMSNQQSKFWVIWSIMILLTLINLIGMEETFLFQLQEKELKEEIFTISSQNSFLKMIVIVLLEESMILPSQTILYFQKLMVMDFAVKFHSIWTGGLISLKLIN